ncbi:threonine/serine dehydratase [Bacteroidota bacterium]
MIGIEGIKSAAKRISPFVLKTPVQAAPLLSERAHCEVSLKLEQLQPTGSFKIRGATNKLLSLTPGQLDRGVVAASTGNHGAAVARAAHLLGGCAIVYVPENASHSKLKTIRDHGAEIRYVGQDGVEAERAARRFARQNALAYISPYNDEQVVMGQGTIGLELIEQIPGLDLVYVSVGGGGLIAGIATCLKSRNPDITIVGCSPENSAVMHHSVQAGRILDLVSIYTLSDGTAGGIEHDTLTFDICRRLVDRWVLVPEPAIEASLRLAINDLQLRIEGSAALAMAGLHQDRDFASGKRVAAVICGGNISEDVYNTISGAG